MKKTVAFFVAACLILTLFSSCKSKQDGSKGSAQTVIMVYMMGSDLESKAGAGTDDLEEMEQSGIDRGATELLVFTGGTSKWHNDVVDSENNYLIRLGDNGFEKINTFNNASMGEADTLSSFLNYVYEHYTAERFALVLWDHGNGPVIGYGKDTAFDKDALTLLEMKQAMENSPFKDGNKLEWVGFDACLMASAELAAVWADYARYLVASQETEPSGGWSYSALRSANTDDTPALLKTVTESYLGACLEYFDSRGYEGREATLACLDLSVTDEMTAAVEALFARCSDDVKDNYDALASLRVNTRGFGRASTGSEYDLVDLKDMAKQLEKLYPNEAKALLEAIEKMVISNSNNTPLSCGLSLYYPFYNKYYYKSGWAEEYSKLGVFPNYLSYLEKYGKNWLVEENAVFSYASSVMPSMVSAGEYSYELTSEQAKRYASCSYHILVKEGQDVYQRVFSSGEVRLDGNKLIADFNGKVIYGKKKNNDYFIPDTVMLDRVGDYVRYSLRVSTNNQYESYPFIDSSTELRNSSLDYDNEYGNEKFDFSRFKDFKPEYGYCRYVMAVNPTASTVSVSAIVPVDENTTVKDLTSGKLKDFDLSEWTTVVFPGQSHCLLRRSDTGVVLPINQWVSNSVVSHVETVASDNVEFVYDYLTGGNYALIFEITDTQGNKYCSEPIDIETKTVEFEPYKYKETDFTWSSGERLSVLDEGGVSVELKKSANSKNKLVFKIGNKTGKDMAITVSDLVLNDSICTKDSMFCNIPNGKYDTDELLIDDSLLYELNAIRINAISFSVKAADIDTRNEILEKQYFNISLGNKVVWSLDPTESQYSSFAEDRTLPATFLGMLARNKVIYNSNGVKVTLLRFGSESEDSYGEAVFRIENTSAKTVNVYSDSCLFDDIMFENSFSATVYSGATVYKKLFFSDSDIKKAGITSASSFALELRFSDSSWNGWMGYGEYQFVNVPLDKAGASQNNFKEGGSVLYNENGIRITLVSGVDSSGCSQLAVVNNSDNDIEIDVIPVKDGEELLSAFSKICYISNERFKAHSKGYCELCRFSYTETGPVTVRFVINNFTGETTLFTAKNTVTVK